MEIDPLSDVLSLLRPRSYISSGFDAGGDWAIQFGPQIGFIKCYSVTNGTCFLSVDDVAKPIHLVKGDSFVLPTGRPFRMGSDLDNLALDASDILPGVQQGGVINLNGGGGFSLVGARFSVSGSHVDRILQDLPPVVHISNLADQKALRWSVEFLMNELRGKQPGSYLVAQHLTHIMLVQALRHFLLESTDIGVGWFWALSDPQLGRAIGAIHTSPAKRWSLAELAREAGMSRSAFSSRFKERLDETPMEYLTRWRMTCASDRLRNSEDTISKIAISMGYESESSFSTAFKRITGSSPRHYTKVHAPYN